jgi:hypothetical protein
MGRLSSNTRLRVFCQLTLGMLIVAGQMWPVGEALAASGQPLDLVTSPLPISLQTTPGTTVTTNIRVQQDEPTTQDLQVTLMKFGAYGTTGRPALMAQGPGDTYFNWVSFSQTKFEAPSNVWENIKMTIKVPKTAAFDYYYAVVFSRVGDNSRHSGEVNSIAGGSAVLVLLTAQVPYAKLKMSLASFTATHKIFEFLPVNFNVTFNNTGNVHLVPEGDVFITQGGHQVASLDINEEQGNILPGSERAYPVQWIDGFPHFEDQTVDGHVVIKNNIDQTHLVFNNGGASSTSFVPHLRFGEYKANLVAAYTNEQGIDVPITASLTFWVIPWRFLLGVLLVLLFIGFGVYATIRGTLRGAKRLSRRK